MLQGTEVFVGTETNSWNRVEETARKQYDAISDWCKLYKYIIRPPADLFVRSNNNNLINSRYSGIISINSYTPNFQYHCSHLG